MKIKLMIVGMFFAAAGVLTAEEASHATDQEAVLAVHVSNGTEGGTVAEGTPVTVKFYHGDHVAREVSMLTDQDGNCTVRGIPTGADMVAVAQARHSEMAFTSSPLQLGSGQKQFDLSFQVFDVAYDNSLIRVGTHHLILQKSGSSVQVSEYAQLINDTDKAVTSDIKDKNGNPQVLMLSLPVTAQNLAFSNYFHPEAIIRTATEFYDTMAIPPGSYHAVFSYTIPLGTEPIDFMKTVTLPTESMMIFVQADSGIMTELGDPAGRMTLKDGTPTEYYQIKVSPGTELTFHVEAITAPPPRLNLWIVFGAVFAVVAAAALLRILKQQPQRKESLP